jgi:hypothetical protein
LTKYSGVFAHTPNSWQDYSQEVVGGPFHVEDPSAAMSVVSHL